MWTPSLQNLPTVSFQICLTWQIWVAEILKSLKSWTKGSGTVVSPSFQFFVQTKASVFWSACLLCVNCQSLCGSSENKFKCLSAEFRLLVLPCIPTENWSYKTRSCWRLWDKIRLLTVFLSAPREDKNEPVLNQILVYLYFLIYSDTFL